MKLHARTCLAILMALVVCSSSFIPASHGQPTPVPEYKLKAAFLVNFARYTTWPDSAFTSPSAPLVIGIVGAGAFSTALADSEPLIIGERRIEFRFVQTIEEAAACHIVFISEREKRHEETWIKAMKSKPVLIVGESGLTLRRGGLLELIVVNDRVRFDASLPAMETAGLRFSAQMLASARQVIRDYPQ